MRSRPQSAAAASATICCPVVCASSPEASSMAETKMPNGLYLIRSLIDSAPDFRPHIPDIRKPLQRQRVAYLLTVELRRREDQLHLRAVDFEVAHERAADRGRIGRGKLVVEHRPALWLDDVGAVIGDRALPRAARLVRRRRRTRERLAARR